MRPLPLALIAALAAGPALADVGAALDDHILPGFAAFADASASLAAAASADCRADALRPGYHAAFDAWMPVAALRIGPSETGALSIAFWPDEKGATPRALAGLIAGADPVVTDGPYAEVSIAARGLFALEMLLFDPAFADYPADSPTCALVQAVAGDLADQAAALNEGWQDFAVTMKTAGDPANVTYLAADEPVRALYTQILSGLEVTADQRIARPLGTFDRPRPARAEAWRSGRSLRNVVLSVGAAQHMAGLLGDAPLPRTDAAVVAVLATADRIADPSFQDIENSGAWLKLEILQRNVRDLSAAIGTELGTGLGITAGFNAMDGD